MTYEDKIRFLKGYRIARENAFALTDQIRDLEMAQLPNGIHYTDMPKHHSNDDQMARFGSEFWELSRELEKAQKRMLKVCAVINQIKETDPDGHRLLTLQYIKCLPKCNIEVELGIAETTRRRWHRKAVGGLNP